MEGVRAFRGFFFLSELLRGRLDLEVCVCAAGVVNVSVAIMTNRLGYRLRPVSLCYMFGQGKGIVGMSKLGEFTSLLEAN